MLMMPGAFQLYLIIKGIKYWFIQQHRLMQQGKDGIQKCIVHDSTYIKCKHSKQRSTWEGGSIWGEEVTIKNFKELSK